MYPEDFEKLLRDLNEYFGLDKIVSPGRFKQWLEKVKDIPTEAMVFIRTKIQDSSDTLPRNIPKHMRACYHEWRNLNASKVMDYPRTDCRECRSLGFLWARRPAWIDGRQVAGRHGPVMEEISYRCALCENWKRHCHEKTKPAATRRQLLDAGYQVLLPEAAHGPAR